MSKDSREEYKTTKKKCRDSKGRKAVIEVLKNINAPLSAEEIFLKIKQAGISINLSTVYRNLDTMENDGLVEKTIMKDSKSRFELTGDEHRHHLICTNCKKMVSFDVCPLREYEKSVRRNTSFDITGHQLVLYGICPDCKKEESNY